MVYQPVYETYQAGEVLLDRSGNPTPVMERVYMYEDQEQTVEREKLVPLDAVYDAQSGTYTIHITNAMDWSGTTDAVRTIYRIVTTEKTIEHDGVEMPYNQYMTDVVGAGVSAYASMPELDEAATSRHRLWYIQARMNLHRTEERETGRSRCFKEPSNSPSR